MTERQEKFALGVLVLVVIFALVWMFVGKAKAEDCPPGIKACQIIVMTPDEVQTLVAPGAMFDAAVYANRMQFETLTKAWREKIAQSPHGTVKAEAPAPKSEPKK